MNTKPLIKCKIYKGKIYMGKKSCDEEQLNDTMLFVLVRKN